MARARFFCLFVFIGSLALAQAPKPLAGSITSHPGWPQPRAADVDSVDHILGALYDVISGPAHQARDWNRMRSLFIPDARLIPVRLVAGTPDPHTAPAADVPLLTIEDYIARSSGRMEAEGFFERGVHNEVAQFGQMVHIFSTYESRHSVADAMPFARGINSIQLLKDGGRYWIVNVLWDSERPDAPLPSQYLPLTTSTSAQLNQFFTGNWVGQLQYRDFSTNERTFLPTWLTMTPSADGHAVTLTYTYDDGPTKTVRETSTLKLDAMTATILSGSDHAPATYALSGLPEFRKLNRGTLVLTGTGTENSKPVDVRITISLRRNLFTWQKETRAASAHDDFVFRDAYTLTRTSPPAF